ncbi:MAG: NrsF family protein [Planctomycetota bacterium]
MSGQPDTPSEPRPVGGFDALRAQIGDDFSAVRPVGPAWRRGLVPVALWTVILGPAVLATGIRDDVDTMGWGFSWAASTLAVLASYSLSVFLVRESTPGDRPSHGIVHLFLLSVLALQITCAWLLHSAHPHVVPDGDHVRVSVACFSAISVLSLPLTGAAIYFALRGVAPRGPLFATLAGASSVVAAEGVWRLHCPFTDLSHFFSAHLPPYLVIAVVTALAVRWLNQRLKARAR